MKDINKYRGIIPPSTPAMHRTAPSPPRRQGTDPPPDRQRRQGASTSAVPPASASTSTVDERKAFWKRDERSKGKLTVIAHVGCNNTADSVELGPPCRERGRGCHCIHSSHLLPPAGVRHCKVLERYVRCCSQHRVRHLQHPPAGRHRPDHEPAEGNAQETPM